MKVKCKEKIFVHKLHNLLKHVGHCKAKVATPKVEVFSILMVIVSMHLMNISTIPLSGLYSRFGSFKNVVREKDEIYLISFGLSFVVYKFDNDKFQRLEGSFQYA